MADERKGLLRICKDTEGLVHLQWGLRSNDLPYNPEDDFIIFPMEAQMKFIPKPGCFVIKFPDDASRNMFFWSQEPKGGIEDQKLTSDVNSALNGESPEDDGPSEQEQLLSMLGAAGGQAPQAQRAQAIRAAQVAAASALATGPGSASVSGSVEATPVTTAAPAATPAAPAKAAAPPGAGASGALGDALTATLGHNAGGTPGAGVGGPEAINAAAMAAALAAGMQQPGGVISAGGAIGQRRAAGPGLSDILTPNSIAPLLRSDDVRSRLLQHLPEEHRSTQDLEELIRTPQFQNQLERFSHALQSGQMDMAQFGLSPGTGFSVAEFLQAIQSHVAEGKDSDAKEGEDDSTMKE